jgi:hypothetical protein
MKIDYKDFIGVFSDVYPEGFCEHLIAEFDRLQTLGVGTDRLNGEGANKHIKNDYQIFSNGKNIDFEEFDDQKTVDLFFSMGCKSVLNNTQKSIRSLKEHA